MIPSIGVMIGLYIIARYYEMGDKCTWAEKCILLVFILVTVCIVWSLLTTGQGVTT